MHLSGTDDEEVLQDSPMALEQPKESLPDYNLDQLPTLIPVKISHIARRKLETHLEDVFQKSSVDTAISGSASKGDAPRHASGVFLPIDISY